MKLPLKEGEEVVFKFIIHYDKEPEMFTHSLSLFANAVLSNYNIQDVFDIGPDELNDNGLIHYFDAIDIYNKLYEIKYTVEIYRILKIAALFIHIRRERFETKEEEIGFYYDLLKKYHETKVKSIWLANADISNFERFEDLMEEIKAYFG
ncbi:MAG: hypothetical protein DRJ41_05025 [Thermoprotei archaeon]|nr:MAG: hypothetical protein DRJ41_05025 [Thermoprotei archaeon]